MAQQEILQAQGNGQRGLTHVEVLDLAKVYDRVDKDILLEVIGEHVEVDVLQMVRATMGPIRARNKGDATDHWADIIRGVLQGVHSSLV